MQKNLHLTSAFNQPSRHGSGSKLGRALQEHEERLPEEEPLGVNRGTRDRMRVPPTLSQWGGQTIQGVP